MQTNLEKENQQLKQQIIDLKGQIYNCQNNKLLFQQSRMAIMGDIIGNIAHQWRQPLAELSSIYMALQANIEVLGGVSNEELLSAIDRSNDVTQHMSQTIENLRNVFKKDKQKELFKLSDQISLVINILNISLKQHNIKLDIIVKKNSAIVGFKSEYAQILINIISNAKEVLVSRKIDNPKIVIKVFEEENKSIVQIGDNAGGIKLENIDAVFEPFFSYEKKNNAGIGLFMSKLIVENDMNGKLSVENTDEGALFTIAIPK